MAFSQQSGSNTKNTNSIRVPSNFDVLIVGAGPTGLTPACLLARQGLNIRIVDKKSGPSKTSKAIGLQYRVSEVLACMGIVDRFLARGGSPTTVNIYAASRKLVAPKFHASGLTSGNGAFTPQPIMIAQSETEEILGTVLNERGVAVE